MNRVEAAIEEGRCVLAIGGRALPQPEVLAELRRRNLIVVSLGSEPLSPAVAPSAEALSAVLDNEGGVLVLVEPDAGVDGRALGELERIVKAGAHKPRLAVVAKAFNPFGLPMALRLLKFEQVKSRATDFLALLPAGPAAAAAPVVVAAAAAPAAASASGRIPAPRPELVGREDEKAALAEMLATDGGPIVVTGPAGVGRRWLVEATLADSGLELLPDFAFVPGVGADAFLGRVALMAKVAGDDRLHAALRPNADVTPTQLAGLCADVLAGEGFAGKAWVLHGLHRLLDARDGAFWRDGRLEMALSAVLTSRPKLRIVVLTDAAPVFYREGQALDLRVLALAGIKGRELHDLFASYQAPEFPRDRFGKIFERTFGHPIISRQLAIAIRENGDVEEVLEQPRFLKAESLGDRAALKRNLKKKVEGLDAEHRSALAKASHLLLGGRPDDLMVLGISRNVRLRLLADGLMEQTPIQGDGRRYYVHGLVAEHLDGREAADFAVMSELARHFVARSKDLKNAGNLVESFAYAQEANRLLVASRQGRDRLMLPYPDNDGLLGSIREIMGRRKNPRLDIARMRINEGRKADPRNSELLILDAELRGMEKADLDAIVAAFDEAAKIAPVPEIFHAEANLHRSRKSRGKAAEALEKGIAAFPDDGRLHRRLGGVYLAQNRVEDAVTVLRRAQELEPMMPDSYGMLGGIYTDMGVEHWEDAEASLDEALRLSPENPMHLRRKADLVYRRATVAETPEARATGLEEAENQLRAALQLDPESWHVQTILAAVILDRDGDLEQAEWLLKKALKTLETVEALVQRARVLLRRQAFGDARQLVERAVKKTPSYHPAFAVLAEIELAEGQVFMAFESYKKARERSPRTAPERARYELRMQELGALIESGAASEMMRQAGHVVQEANEAGIPMDGPRRDAGSTTILRKTQRAAAAAAAAAEGAEGAEGAAAAEASDAAAPVEAPVADAPADEPAVEAAPVDEPVVDEPVVDEPVVDEPVVEEPTPA